MHRLIGLPADAPSSATPHPQDRAAHQIHDYLHLVAALGANPAPLPPKLEVTAAEIQQAEQDLLADWRHKAVNAAAGKPLTYLPIDDASHNDVFAIGGRQIESAISTLVAQLSKQPAATRPSR